MFDFRVKRTTRHLEHRLPGSRADRSARTGHARPGRPARTRPTVPKYRAPLRPRSTSRGDRRRCRTDAAAKHAFVTRFLQEFPAAAEAGREHPALRGRGRIVWAGLPGCPAGIPALLRGLLDRAAATAAERVLCNVLMERGLPDGPGHAGGPAVPDPSHGRAGGIRTVQAAGAPAPGRGVLTLRGQGGRARGPALRQQTATTPNARSAGRSVPPSARRRARRRPVAQEPSSAEPSSACRRSPGRRAAHSPRARVTRPGPSPRRCPWTRGSSVTA